MPNIYTVEIDGRVYEIEGDSLPTEQEARQAVGVFRNSPTAAEAPVAAEPSDSRGALERFAEPFMETAKGVGNLVKMEAGKMRSPSALLQYAKDVGGIAKHIGSQQLEEFAKAKQAFGRGGAGGVSEGVARLVTGAVPVVGPAVGDIGEAVGEGNIAGAVGQGVLLGAPLAKPGKAGGVLQKLLRNREAARALSTLSPSGVGLARDVAEVAPRVFRGAELPSGARVPGLRPGGTKNLAEQAERMTQNPDLLAEQKALRSLTSGTRAAEETAAELESRAASRETLPPPHIEMRPSDSRLVDAYGDPVMEAVEVQPAASSSYKELSNALRAEADRLLKIQQDFDAAGMPVPMGEMFKQRAGMGERASVKGAFGQAAETEAGPVTEAAGQARGIVSDILHREYPPSQITDKATRLVETVNRAAQQAFENTLTNKGMAVMRSLLEGRVLGNIVRGPMMGFAGGMATGGGIAAGTAGALVGSLLSSSRFWQSLRGATYSKLAQALERGAEREAGQILDRALADFAIQEAQQQHRASTALQDQGNSVVDK